MYSNKARLAISHHCTNDTYEVSDLCYVYQACALVEASPLTIRHTVGHPDPEAKDRLIRRNLNSRFLCS